MSMADDSAKNKKTTNWAELPDSEEDDEIQDVKDENNGSTEEPSTQKDRRVEDADAFEKKNI